MSTKIQLKVEHILIHQIDPSFYQKRTYFDEEKYKEILGVVRRTLIIASKGNIKK
jgi:ParB-like chromosome segregation protein Spo0J